MAEKATQELERIYTIPLRDVKSSPRNHQADRAIRHIKRYLARHMKSDDVWIDASVNEFIWARGMYQVPSRIRVRARRFDDGVIEVSLPEIETKESIRGEIKARREQAEEKKEKKAAEKAAQEKEAAKGEEKPEAPKIEVEPRKKTPWSERKVLEIEGVGPKFDAELAKVNIRLMDQLLAADADEVAKKTGIGLTLVKTWQGMADLDRLDTINNQYAELLVRAGITRVQRLTELSPKEIVEKCEAYLKTVERPPTRQPLNETIAGLWLQEARKIAGQSAAKK